MTDKLLISLPPLSKILYIGKLLYITGGVGGMSACGSVGQNTMPIIRRSPVQISGSTEQYHHWALEPNSEVWGTIWPCSPKWMLPWVKVSVKWNKKNKILCRPVKISIWEGWVQISVKRPFWTLGSSKMYKIPAPADKWFPSSMPRALWWAHDWICPQNTPKGHVWDLGLWTNKKADSGLIACEYEPRRVMMLFCGQLCILTVLSGCVWFLLLFEVFSIMPVQEYIYPDLFIVKHWLKQSSLLAVGRSHIVQSIIIFQEPILSIWLPLSWLTSKQIIMDLNLILHALYINYVFFLIMYHT